MEKRKCVIQIVCAFVKHTSCNVYKSNVSKYPQRESEVSLHQDQTLTSQVKGVRWEVGVNNASKDVYSCVCMYV